MEPQNQNYPPDLPKNTPYETPMRPPQPPVNAQNIPPPPVAPQQFDNSFTPAPPSNFQNAQPAYGPQPKKGAGKFILVMIGILAIGVLAAAALTAQSDKKHAAQTKASTATKNEAKQKASEAPAGWKKIETGLGFSMNIPEGWSTDSSPEATEGNFTVASLILSSPDIITTEAYVVASKESLTDSKDQAAFEAAVSQLDPSLEATYGALGINKDDIKISTERLTIGEKQWLAVQMNMPGQWMKSFYLWHKDYAVALTAIQNSQEKLDSITSTYLQPMAASVTLKD